MNLRSANNRVIDALSALDIKCNLKLLDHETRTSQAAAQSLGCSVGQIAKSLIFSTVSGRAVLAVTSGSNRVVLSAVSDLVGEKIAKADADFVRQKTGFAIGGVAPVGMTTPIETVFDRDLFQHDIVWAAGGTANSLFAICNKDLRKLAGDRIFDFAVALD